MFIKSIFDWLNPDREGKRPTTRAVHDCQKCKLKINYGFDKSGSFIACPRCRVSIKLPEKPKTVRCESESGFNYQVLS